MTKNLEGRKFNKLTVIRKDGKSLRGSLLWLCQCECGVEKTFSVDHLTRKNNPVKSCGCLRKRKGSHNPLFRGIGEISNKWWRTHVDRYKLRPGINVEIDQKYAWELFLSQKGKCALSGVPLEFSSDAAFNTASLDRIDSSLGYVEGNLQWVHKDINLMKRTLEQSKFIEWCRKVVTYKNATGICEI